MKYLKSFTALGKKPSPGNMETADDEEDINDEDRNWIWLKLEETRNTSAQRLHQAKRVGDLAKNFILNVPEYVS